MYDADQLGALAHYRSHITQAPQAARDLHYLIIGPWDHAGTRSPKTEFGGLKFGNESLVDLAGLHLDWYRWTMQGGEKPAFLKDRVAYYVTEADRWRYAPTLDAITGETRTLHLSSHVNPGDVFHSGTMQESCINGRDFDEYLFDPRDLSHLPKEMLVDPESLVDQSMIHVLAGKQLVYHSHLFDEDTEISGFFKLRAWISIDQPDTDFIAYIYEIDENGSSILLTVDWVRARFRQGLRREQLISTNEPILYVFDEFPFVSRLVRAGRRLRLVVGPINSIFLERNPNNGEVIADSDLDSARSVMVKLYHDGEHDSVLELPIGKSNETEESAPSNGAR
jgi:hypothetical protein